MAYRQTHSAPLLTSRTLRGKYAPSGLHSQALQTAGKRVARCGCYAMDDGSRRRRVRAPTSALLLLEWFFLFNAPHVRVHSFINNLLARSIMWTYGYRLVHGLLARVTNKSTLNRFGIYSSPTVYYCNCRLVRARRPLTHRSLPALSSTMAVRQAKAPAHAAPACQLKKKKSSPI